jgi:hypothetical protein
MSEKLKEIRRKIEEERETLFLKALDLFANFDNEGRNFFIKIATISATIGAFSFLVFDKVENQLFLRIGDSLLLVVIIYSIAVYYMLFKKDLINFHQTYHNIFKRNTRHIEMIQKLESGLISPEDFKIFMNDEINKINEYKRPSVERFANNKIIIIILSLALILICLSFFNLMTLALR